MIPATHHRLLTRGDLPDSMGGLYNPGAWAVPGAAHCLMTVRHEKDYSWTQPCLATIVRVAGVHAQAVDTIPFVGFDAGTRFEDLRPFVWRDEVLISHVAYQPGSGKPVRQRLSRLRADWSAIERWDDWNTDVFLGDIEKNWALVSTSDALYAVYSLSPFMLLRKDAGWRRYGGDDNRWANGLGHRPRCSTHLLPWRDGYLGFWHTRLDGVYVQGAYWLDRDLRLRRRSGILLDGQDVQYRHRYRQGEPVNLSIPEEIYKPGVLYVSSWVDRGDDLWLFAGVGDAHSEVIVVKADDVDRRLR